MNEIKLTIHPFEMDSLKEAAKKIQEEAGEAFVEFLLLHEGQSKDTTRLEDELSDCIQACCNMLMRYGADPQAAMERCEQRNRERGRYEDADSCGIRDGSDCGRGRSCGAASFGVGVLRRPPEEMSAEELFRALKATNEFDDECRKILGDDWCKNFGHCSTCRIRLLNLLKEAHEREVASLEYEKSYHKERIESYERDYDDVRRKIADLTHERDGLRRRLEELSDAGIAELHRTLKQAIGDAKNATDTARVYAERERKAHGGSKERKAVIERLRKIDFAQERVTLYKIAVAILGYEPASSPWWGNESHAKLRDKLIELLSE